MTRLNPFDSIDGPHLLTAISFFTEHHKPSLLLDCAVLSAKARGHYRGNHTPKVAQIPTPELLKIVKGKRVADAYVAEREIRERVKGPGTLNGKNWICDGHLHQSY